MEIKTIQSKIYQIRGQKVMLDYDLALLYQTETRTLKQAVRRNIDRFPSDFMFELTQLEVQSLRSQIVMSKPGRGGTRHKPFAFTEQGFAMLASILNSPTSDEPFFKPGVKKSLQIGTYCDTKLSEPRGRPLSGHKARKRYK